MSASPAAPHNEKEPKGAAQLVYNLELRDLFAGFALSGLLSSAASTDEWYDLETTAYRFADGMLAARGKR